MTAPYNKRMKGGWRQGKGCKGDGEERQYSKSEIKQQLAEAEEDYLDKYHKGARTKNMRARLKYRIKWYEDVIARYEIKISDTKTSSTMSNWFRDGSAKAKKRLEEIKMKPKKR